jgi:hypothetical protein
LSNPIIWSADGRPAQETAGLSGKPGVGGSVVADSVGGVGGRVGVGLAVAEGLGTTLPGGFSSGGVPQPAVTRATNTDATTRGRRT